jgi:3-oxoacyl-[acyl-carrier-protein] synthase II
MSLEAPDFAPRKEIDPTTRIVVTGMGVIGPNGIGVEDFWQNIKDGKSGIVTHRFDQYPQIKASVAGMVPEDFKPEVALAGIISTKDIRNKLHRSAHFSLAASFEALQQAGLLIQREGEDAKDRKWKINPQIVDPSEVAAIVGTGIGGGEVIAKVQLALDAKKRANPSDILHVLPERVLTPVTMAFGIKGPAYTVVAACATGNSALGAGLKEIMMGEAKAAVVGSAEASNNPIGFAMFDVMRALDTEADPMKTPRPFDISAGRVVMGEGAGILVLERIDFAR